MRAVLNLQDDHLAVAQRIVDETRQMEQTRGQRGFFPYTLGAQTVWAGTSPPPPDVNQGRMVIRIGIAAWPSSSSTIVPQLQQVPPDQEIITFTLTPAQSGTTSLEITYHEQLERFYERSMRVFLREYARLISRYWPETNCELRKQLGNAKWIMIADNIASPVITSPDPGLEPETLGHAARFKAMRRNRADLFKELKHSHPGITQRKLASLAWKESKERVKRIAEDHNTNIHSQRVDEIAKRMHNDMYGPREFNVHDVRNDWREMQVAGEVGPWERSGS